jgi:hypothetical protein
VQIARNRVRAAATGRLRFREDGPIHIPSTTDALAQIPAGFWTNRDDSPVSAGDTLPVSATL